MADEIIVGLSVLGLLISLYAIYIQHRAKSGKKALCDLSKRVSCTSVLTSKYSKILWMSNTNWGVLFYLSMMGLAVLEINTLILAGSALSALVSVGLAYLAWVKLKTLCPVCTLVYIINFALLFRSLSM